MGKALAIAGLVVGGLIALAFGLDLALGIPFDGANMIMDAGFLTCGLMLAYMGWNAFRDIK